MKLLKFTPNVQGFTLNYKTNMTRKKFEEKNEDIQSQQSHIV